MPEISGPTREEMTFPLSQRLHELNLWIHQELKEKETKRILGSNISILLARSQKGIGNLARETKCDPSHISRVKKGKAVPSFLLLNSWARALGTNVKVLLEVDLAERLMTILDEYDASKI